MANFLMVLKIFNNFCKLLTMYFYGPLALPLTWPTGSKQLMYLHLDYEFMTCETLYIKYILPAKVFCMKK